MTAQSAVWCVALISLSSPSDPAGKRFTEGFVCAGCYFPAVSSSTAIQRSRSRLDRAPVTWSLGARKYSRCSYISSLTWKHTLLNFKNLESGPRRPAAQDGAAPLANKSRVDVGSVTMVWQLCRVDGLPTLTRPMLSCWLQPGCGTGCRLLMLATIQQPGFLRTVPAYGSPCSPRPLPLHARTPTDRASPRGTWCKIAF